MRQDWEEFRRRDTVVVVIGPDPPGRFREYWEQNDIPFVGLPDAKASVLKRYGQEVDLFRLGRMPAQMIVDRKGILRYVHYGHDMKDIPSNREILDLLDGLQEEPPDAG